MSSSQLGNVVETVAIDFDKQIVDGERIASSLPHLEMSTTTSLSPRELPSAPINAVKREGSSSATVRSSARSFTPVTGGANSKSPTSSIPLPVRLPKTGSPASRVSSQTVTARSAVSGKLSRPSSAVLKGPNQTTNKHTLEIQFINKKKRLSLLKKDLLEKQKPVLDLYQNLVQIKKRLEELGKIVYLEEVKFYDGENDKGTGVKDGGGEKLSPEMVFGMQSSIEEIPNTLMDICRNLLGRRNVIVELLESIIKSEVDVSELTDQIERLKTEGEQLQSNLDVVINEHHHKIKEIIHNWQTLLNDKKQFDTGEKVEELQEKLRYQEKLTEESNTYIQELQKKLDDKRSGHDRYVNELNNVIHALKDQIQKLEQELEVEKKSAVDYRNRNNTNAQNSKMLRNKILELENDKKSSESLNSELNRKVKILQDQLKHKEAQWLKEKDELAKSLKHQENLLQKLTAEKNTFETRLETIEGERVGLEENLQSEIVDLKKELDEVKATLTNVTKEKDEALNKCAEMEEHISRMGVENRETMNMVSNSIDWGTDVPGTVTEAQKYSQSMMKDILLREYQDKIKKLEAENNQYLATIAMVENTKMNIPTETEKAVMMQHDVVLRYKQLLADSEQKLTEKSQEVARLTSEIRQLKVRQEHLEELNQKCPTENLQKMVEEGRSKLNDLMKKSLESEQKILHCENIIDKQSKQMNEMENLLRYRENMAGVLKASRDELVLEKESLTRYSHEMRTVLAEVTKEGKMKDRLIKELQEKIDLRERQISKLEKEVRELEANLMMTNEKRFKLQETIGSMEKELQSTKAHVNQLADINTRYDIGMRHSSSSSIVKCVSIKPSCNIEPYLEACESRLTEDPKPLTDFNDIHELLERLKIPEPRHEISLSTHDLCQVHISTHSANVCQKHSATASFVSKKSLRNVSTSFEELYANKKLNSRSLLGLSLKQVDFLRSRLDYLTKVNVSPVKSAQTVRKVPSKVCSVHSLNKSSNANPNLVKIVELTAKRYEFLQKQAYESYEELTSLVKLAMSAQKICDK